MAADGIRSTVPDLSVKTIMHVVKMQVNLFGTCASVPSLLTLHPYSVGLKGEPAHAVLMLAERRAIYNCTNQRFLHVPWCEGNLI